MSGSGASRRGEWLAVLAHSRSLEHPHWAGVGGLHLRVGFEADKLDAEAAFERANLFIVTNIPTCRFLYQNNAEEMECIRQMKE